MNNTQKIISALTGYEHNNSCDSANDTNYEVLETDQERIEYIKSYSRYAEDADGNSYDLVNAETAELIMKTIKDMSSVNQSNDGWHIFEALNPRWDEE